MAPSSRPRRAADADAAAATAAPVAVGSHRRGHPGADGCGRSDRPGSRRDAHGADLADDRAIATAPSTGPAVQIRWGIVQVQVTISGGVITDVAALQLPTGDPHSSEISQRAAPVLRSAALAAQSAEITILSGATYTSLAYAQSLQAALDSARA